MPSRSTSGAAPDAADDEACADRRRRAGRSRSRRRERVLREEDLADVDGAATERRDAPGRRAPRAAGGSGATVRKPSARSRPVPARERRLALQPPRRDARDEQRRDEERHGVDPVRGVRPAGRGEQAAEQRADRPGSRSRPPAGARSPRAARPRGRDSGRPRTRPAGRSPSRDRRRAASATIAAGLVANGSAQKTAARMRSAPIISVRRSSRSSSGPSVSPTRIVGRNSTMSTAPTQSPSPCGP